MRFSVFVCVALVGVILAEGTSSGSCEHFTRQRAKPREIRGNWEPEYVSTAIGFGKRETPAKQDKFDRIIRYFLQNSAPPQSGIPVGWFLNQMRKNPELAKQVVRKIVDDSSDEDNSSASRMSTSEHFNAERTIPVF